MNPFNLPFLEMYGSTDDKILVFAQNLATLDSIAEVSSSNALKSCGLMHFLQHLEASPLGLSACTDPREVRNRS